ncbi:BspA family leucine-rich repeat surface protein [archaeon]|nr:MAG: BspA family leucine-rich repeat surface protein [archaeon]
MSCNNLWLQFHSEYQSKVKQDFNYINSMCNASNVTCMESMFIISSSFSKPIDCWDVRQVTTMEYRCHRV